jgi:gliding motility-associated-like protein
VVSVVRNIVARVIVVAMIVFSCAGYSYAQLVTASQTPASLVTNTLLGGGVQVSNIQYSGSTGAIGFFNGANTNIGLQSGIIMTTGNISGNMDGPKGPNNMPNAGVDNGTPGPPSPASTFLANLISTSNFYNGTVLRFDFIPEGNTISFKYVFGSEEYPEYVGSQYNDVFGFFLIGPGISGAMNLATVPGTTTPVAINNINMGPDNLGCSNCAYYTNNDFGQTIQYDGFTKPLIAQANVIPCSTYTIILAITDVGDGIFDSGVFLDAKSFTTNSVTISSQIFSDIVGSNELYEGCGYVKVTIKRAGDISTTQTINYTLAGSTANAADITPSPFPLSVTFAPGETEKEIIINAIMDGITEGDETLVITLTNATPCPTSDPPKVEIVIKDASPINVVAPNDLFLACNNEAVDLNAIITGGTVYTVSWDNGLQGNPITVFPNVTTTYTVSVYDICLKDTVQDDVTIHIPAYTPLSLTASNDTAICGGEQVILRANAIGGIGFNMLSWSTGETNVDSIIIYPNTSTQVTITASDSCGNVKVKKINITVQRPVADFGFSYIENNEVSLIDFSTGDVVDWLWVYGDGDSDFVQNPTHVFRDTGLYVVALIVRNHLGCYDTLTKVIRSYPPFEFFVPNAFTPNGDVLNDFFNGKGQGFIEYNMEIYDRWGLKMFETNYYGRGWSGKTASGKDIPIGVYLYKINIGTPPGRRYFYSGHFTLVR